MPPLNCVLFRGLRIRAVLRRLRFVVPLIVVVSGLAPGFAAAQQLLTLETSILTAKRLNLGFAVEEQMIHSQAIEVRKARADTRPVVSYTGDCEQLFGVKIRASQSFPSASR